MLCGDDIAITGVFSTKNPALIPSHQMPQGCVHSLGAFCLIKVGYSFQEVQLCSSVCILG